MIHPDNMLMPLLLACAWLAGGCVSPTVTTFDHAPAPSLRQAKPFPATVAIMPWEDKRQRISVFAPYALIPGVLYGVSELQNGPGPEQVEDPDSGLVQWMVGGPTGTEELPPLLARYLRDSSVFAEILLAGRPYGSGMRRLKNLYPGMNCPASPASADFTIMSVMKTWSCKRTAIMTCNAWSRWANSSRFAR